MRLLQRTSREDTDKLASSLRMDGCWTGGFPAEGEAREWPRTKAFPLSREPRWQGRWLSTAKSDEVETCIFDSSPVGAVRGVSPLRGRPKGFPIALWNPSGPHLCMLYCFQLKNGNKKPPIKGGFFSMALYLTYDTMPTFETRRLSNVILLEFR